MDTLRNNWQSMVKRARHGLALRPLHALSYVLPLLVLAGSLLIAGNYRHMQQQELEQDIKNDFDVRVRETVSIFKERVRNAQQVLFAMQGFYAASNQVNATEFNVFVSNINLDQIHGFQGIGYIGVEPHSARTAVRHYRTFSGETVSRIGTDYLAEPSRRYALEAARDTAAVAVSNKLKLPGEDEQTIQAGYQIVLPVYRNGVPHDTLAERRRNLSGWIFATFSMNGMIDNILGERPNIAIEIVDGADVLLADAGRDRVGGDSPVKLFSSAAPVAMGDYDWTIVAHSLPNLTSHTALSSLQLRTRIAWVASTLLAFLTWIFLRWRIRSRQAASQLQQAKEHAEQANLDKSKFLAAASHDLRQPIHALCLFLDVLANTELNEQQQKLLNNIRAASDATRDMLNTLLDFSRIDAGVVEPHRQVFSLQNMLDNLNNDFQPQALAKGLRYRARITNLYAYSDPMLVELILRNLVSNAIRYTEHGSVLLACRVRGDAICIDVRDSGIGIAAEDQQNIFREFHQLGNPERNRSKGLGLGLAIVDGLVRTLHLQLTLRSASNCGSVFRVTLPKAKCDFHDVEPALFCREKLQARVLVIEDDAAVSEGMVQLLSNWGCDCIATDTAEAALQWVRRHAFDLVISDLRLRGSRTGIDAIAAIRAELGYDIPALLITGDTAPHSLRLAQASGISMLHKPVLPRLFYQQVAAQLQVSAA